VDEPHKLLDGYGRTDLNEVKKFWAPRRKRRSERGGGLGLGREKTLTGGGIEQSDLVQGGTKKVLKKKSVEVVERGPEHEQ